MVNLAIVSYAYSSKGDCNCVSSLTALATTHLHRPKLLWSLTCTLVRCIHSQPQDCYVHASACYYATIMCLQDHSQAVRGDACGSRCETPSLLWPMCNFPFPPLPLTKARLILPAKSRFLIVSFFIHFHFILSYRFCFLHYRKFLVQCYKIPVYSFSIIISPKWNHSKKYVLCVKRNNKQVGEYMHSAPEWP